MKTQIGLKYLRRLAYVLISLYCLLVLLTSTYPGTRALFALATATIPARITVDSLSGSLTSGLRIHNLIYQDHTGRIQGETIAVKINLASLLSFHLLIDNLLINNVSIYQVTTDDIETKSSSKNSISLTPPSWLKRIDLGNINISNVHYFQGENTFSLTSALINRTSPHQYRYAIDSSIGKAQGTAALSYEPIFSWNINLKLSGKTDSGPASGSTSINYENENLHINNLNLIIGSAHLKATGVIGDKLNLVWNIDIPDIGLLIPNADGRMTSNGTINGTAKNPNIKARMNLKNFASSDINVSHLVADINTVNASLNNINTTISVYGLNFNDIKVSQGKIDFDTRLVKSNLITNIIGHLDQETRLSGIITFPDFENFLNGKQKINAKINLNTPDLSTLPLSIPEISNLNGALNAKATISGEISKPNISLTASLTNAAATIVPTGAKLTNINANLLYQPNRPLELNASLTAGEGTANIKGKLTSSDSNYDFSLGIDGQNLKIADTHEYQILVTPNLTLNFTDAGAKISGNVLIPKAKIYPVEFDNVVNIPDETTFVHKKQSESLFYKNLVLDIQAKLGDHIHIKYDNFKTRLHGDLHIIKNAGSLPTAIGTLFTARGSYKAYGTELNIQTGRIIYAGNQITNPGLDVRATKAVRRVNTSSNADTGESSYSGQDTLTVGLSVQGTADKPRLSFFSEPGGLSQKDILSYLLFGYPQSQIGSASALALLGSIAPGGNNTSGITDNIQNTLGLTELGMGSSNYIDPATNTAGSTSTVNVGKQINDKLSIHYSIGLLYPISVLNIRYQINRHLSFQAETSTNDTGADLVYSLERK